MRGSWANRRRLIYIVCGFCMGVVIAVLALDLEGETAETAVSQAFLLLGAVVGSYVFGAAWDDRNKRQFQKPGGDK